MSSFVFHYQRFSEKQLAIGSRAAYGEVEPNIINHRFNLQVAGRLIQLVWSFILIYLLLALLSGSSLATVCLICLEDQNVELRVR
jgi:hypothetical protein